MIQTMTACASCGAKGVAPGASCPQCGAIAVPDLELVARAPGSPKDPQPASEPEAQIELELAVDPSALVHERSHGRADGSPVGAEHGGNTGLSPSPGALVRSQAASPGVIAREPSRSGRPSRHPNSMLAIGDLAFDARLLADYGSPPQGWLRAPFYAWRVLRRQRELKRAHGERREEAARTAIEVEDALVAFAERARPAAERQPSYGAVVEELRRAEDLLRSRDRVLATEQDAQNARIAQVDARLAKLEEEFAQAQADERAAAGELAAAQAALAREEAKLKRAEVELRAAQHRESSGEVGG